MNREVNVRFSRKIGTSCEEQGVRIPLLTRLCVRATLATKMFCFKFVVMFVKADIPFTLADTKMC